MIIRRPHKVFHALTRDAVMFKHPLGAHRALNGWGDKPHPDDMVVKMVRHDRRRHTPAIILNQRPEDRDGLGLTAGDGRCSDAKGSRNATAATAKYLG